MVAGDVVILRERGIAVELVTTKNTAASHITNVLGKLGAQIEPR